MNPRILVGFSVNPEGTIRFNSAGAPEKGTLDEFSVGPAGAGANITQALISLEEQATLLGFVGPQGTASRALLDFALKRHSMPSNLFEVLEETGVAFLPLDEANGQTSVYGARGRLDADKSYVVMEELRSLEIRTGDFVVASGVLASELPFAAILFQRATPGCRLFGPKRTLCGTEALRAFLPNCDLLILNQAEWDLCQMSYSEVHDLGPKLVIITQDERGCDFSLDGTLGHIDAFHVDGPIYTTGAGDWFFAGLVAAMVKRQVSVGTITESGLKECLGFAAKVAGLKVKKPGGTFGPTLEEVEKVVAS